MNQTPFRALVIVTLDRHMPDPDKLAHRLNQRHRQPLLRGTRMHPSVRLRNLSHVTQPARRALPTDHLNRHHEHDRHDTHHEHHDKDAQPERNFDVRSAQRLRYTRDLKRQRLVGHGAPVRIDGMDDVDIAIKKWGLAKLQERYAKADKTPPHGWRAVTVKFDHHEGYRYSSWTEEDSRYEITIDLPGYSRTIDMIKGEMEFPDLLREILAQPILDEDRS